MRPAARPIPNLLIDTLYALRRRESDGDQDLCEPAGKDLERSVGFFTKLGYKFNPQFTDETAACMIVSDDISVMLLTQAKFKEFTPKAICDATKSTEVLVCLSCESREQVDAMVSKAVGAGGATYAESKDYGFMYQHAFQDLDGHIWELIYMEPSAIKQG
jgi:predicted lactoylglutathione lyase